MKFSDPVLVESGTVVASAGFGAWIRGIFLGRRTDRARLWARVESLEKALDETERRHDADMSAREEKYNTLFREHAEYVAKYDELLAKYDALSAEVARLRARQNRRIVREQVKPKGRAKK